MKKLLTSFFCCILASCATTDTGSVDFRRAESQSLKTVQKKFLTSLKECSPNIAGKKERTCAPMAPTSLARKFVGKAAKAINKDEVYSIRLDYGVIADMNEIRKPSLRKGGKFAQNGEVVILVKAFEFSADKNNPEGFLNFSQSTKEGDEVKDDFSQARVVYFNPDVDAGQQLNISNIPILGPVKYGGRPVGLQLIILELDKMSDPVKSVMQNLADLGRSYVNAGPVTDTLFDLGTSLIEGSLDDIIFEYRMVMDNVEHTKDQIVSPFEEGRVVFRRVQDRDNDLIWRNMRVDENSGALYVVKECVGKKTHCVLDENSLQQKFSTSSEDPAKKGDDKKRFSYYPYKKETYLTVNFINHGKDGPEAFFEMEKFEDIQERLDTYINERDKPIESLEQPIVDLISRRQSLNKSRELSDMVASMGTAWASYSHYKLPATFKDSELCPTYTRINDDLAKRNLKLTDARRMTGQFYDSLKEVEAELLKSTEKNKLLARLSELLLGRLSGDGTPTNYLANDFTSWENFWTKKYKQSTGKEALVALFEEAAELAAPKNCGELNAIH